MKVTDKIKTKIDRIDAGEVFGYDMLGITSNEVIAASKALSRLVEKVISNEQKKVFITDPK